MSDSGSASFNRPAEEDFLRMLEGMLTRLTNDADRKKALAEAEAVRWGSARDSRLDTTLPDAILPFYEQGVREALRLVAEFHERHGHELGGLVEMVRPPLDAFSADLRAKLSFRRNNPLGVHDGVAEVEGQFRRRVEDAIRDDLLKSPSENIGRAVPRCHAAPWRRLRNRAAGRDPTIQRASRDTENLGAFLATYLDASGHKK